MPKSIMNATRGVTQEEYYNKGAVQAPSGIPKGAVPMGSFSSYQENKQAQGCYLTKKDGSACKAPVIRNTDLCVGHTKQIEKGAEE